MNKGSCQALGCHAEYDNWRGERDPFGCTGRDRTRLRCTPSSVRRVGGGASPRPAAACSSWTPISLAAHYEGRIVGHVLFSPMILDPPKPCLGIVGLAPVGVLPEHQGRGIGSRLIRQGLLACGEAGYGAAVVLGEPGYYTRFGFGRASGCGIGNEYGVDEPFMVVELKKGALHETRVTVKYQPEFRWCGL